MLSVLTAQQSAPEPAKPEPVRTSITVTEKISAETPANVSEITPHDLERTPGTNLDDRLRQVPGFSLFRRTSSVVANPTTQGISLRGIGSSGASRTLVLFDGVPANDPFGGWVYWTRFIPEELERVEVSRGASTSVFGDLAMGGAIGLFSREPQHLHVAGGYEFGSQNSHDVWAGFSDLESRFAISGSGRGYTTDGYFIVPPNIRGAIDRRANVRFVNSTVRVDAFAAADRLFTEVNILAEERANGTALTHNSTALGTASLHYAHEFTRDTVSLTGFLTSEQFHSSFTSVPANRNSEQVTFRQTVPSDALGADILWNHAATRWNAVVGADVNNAHGFSTDALVPTGRRVGGGTLLQHGVFAQTDYRWGAARFFLGARHQFTGQDRQFFSPSGGLVYGQGRWRARGSVYRSFRSPTLNELYREFRVGNTVTQANAALRPETLFGAEAGLDFITETANVRVTAFRNAISGLITNVTVSLSGGLIVRQRRNAVDALNRGFEVNGAQRWRNWRGQMGYLFVDSRYATGPRVPQVPRHQGSAELSFQRGGTLLSGGVRSYAAQFEDDLNRFVLPGFATLQFMARQQIVSGLSGSVAFENLLDRQYLAGFSPTPIIGAPRLWRVGLHWH